jgi:hypothetical protein
MAVYIASTGTLTSFSEDVDAFATASSARTSKLLKAIEDTVVSLCYDQRLVSTFSGIARDTAESIRAKPQATPLDESGEVNDKLLRAQRTAKKLHDQLVKKYGFAKADERLTPEDGVWQEFERTIIAVATLHDEINDLRWVVGEHDATLAAPNESKPIASPEHVEAYLEKI